MIWLEKAQSVKASYAVQMMHPLTRLQKTLSRVWLPNVNLRSWVASHLSRYLNLSTLGPLDIEPEMERARDERQQDHIPEVQEGYPANAKMGRGFEARRQVQPTDEGHRGIDQVVGPDHIPEVFEYHQGLPGAVEHGAGDGQRTGSPFSLCVSNLSFGLHRRSPLCEWIEIG